MMSSDELNTIIERIASGTQMVTDVNTLRVVLSDRNQDLLQPSITHQVDAVRLRQAGVED